MARKKNCLLDMLQNVTGKTVPEDTLKNCRTTCEVLDAFNDLYACVVNFTGVISSTNVTSSMTVTVKDANGETVNPVEARKYRLKEGSYTYSAEASGAVAKNDVAFTITNSDEQTGTKNMIVQFTAA